MITCKYENLRSHVNMINDHIRLVSLATVPCADLPESGKVRPGPQAAVRVSS